MQLKFPLSRMMLWVAISAVAAAFGVFVVELKEREVLGFTIGFLVAGMVGGWVARGLARVFWWGFALSGGSYLFAVFGFDQALSSSFPTTRPLAHLGESLHLLPMTIAQPEDVLPMVLRVVKYLRVAQSLVALGVGVLGGSVALVVYATGREVWKRTRRHDQAT